MVGSPVLSDAGNYSVFCTRIDTARLVAVNTQVSGTTVIGYPFNSI
jgi:hypothetical protein